MILSILAYWKLIIGSFLFFGASVISDILSFAGYTFVFFGTDMVIYACGAFAGSMLIWGILESPKHLLGGYFNRRDKKRSKV